MPGARATRSSLRIEQPDLPSTEDRAAAAAQAEVLPNAVAVSRAQPGRGQKRKLTEVSSSHVESTKSPAQIVDDTTLPGVEPRSGGSAKLCRKAAGKAFKAQLQTSSPPVQVQTRSQLESDDVSHVQHDTGLASNCRPRQQQQANERQKSGDKANAQASNKQIPAAGTSQPHADSTAPEMPSDNRADQQQVKRRKATSVTAQATQVAEQLTTAASGSIQARESATHPAADSQQQGLPNKRARLTSRAPKRRNQSLAASAQATAANSSQNTGAEVPSHAQAASQGIEAPQVVTAKPGPAKQSKSAASKRNKTLPARAAAPKRSRTVAAAAELEQQAPALSSKSGKSNKSPKGTTARQAAKGASVPTDAAGAKQPARRTRAAKAAGQALGQQQQVHAGQDSSRQPASRLTAALSTAASQTHALASKVVQQAMGLSAKSAPALKRSDGLKPAGTLGETSGEGLTTTQPGPAKSSSLSGLASVLASKSKEEGSGARTSMLPFLPRPQPPATQPVSASRQHHPHRPASATASAAASVDSDRQQPAAESSQQACDALVSKSALPTAALPCYEPGFLTQAFSVSAFSAKRNQALDELQQLLCAAEESQTDLPDVEAASLRITPLEEQLQAAATELPVLQREMQELKQTQGRRRRPPRNPVVAHPGSGQTTQALPGQQAGTQQQPQQQPAHQAASQQAKAQVQQPAARQGQQSATPQGQQCATTRAQQSKGQQAQQLAAQQAQQSEAQQAQQPVAQQGLQSAITRAQRSKAQQSEAQQRQQTEVQQPAAQQGQQSATQHAQRSKAQQAKAQQSGPTQRQQQSDAQQAQQPAAQQRQQGAKQHAQQSRAQQAQQPAAQQAQQSEAKEAQQLEVKEAQQSEAKEAQQSAAHQRQAAPLLSHQQAASSATAHLEPAALPQPVSTAEPCNSAEAGNAAGDRAKDGDQSGTRAECRSRGDTGANTASTALNSKQAISAKALAATDEAVKSIKAKWQQGLDEAAKVLSCLQFLQQTGPKTARQRWNRNTSSELQAPQAALDGQASASSQTCDAAAQSTAAGQASAVRTAASDRAQPASEGSDDAEGRGGGGLAAGDTVLVFAIHRFDSAGIRSGQSLVEIAVLASQPLTALRDAIECEADVNLASQHQSRPAGFFYIEGTFYNDMRHVKAEDYSFAIRRFCSQRGITVPCSAPTDPPAYAASSLQPSHHSNNSCQPQALHMEKTCFDDLCLRIGQGAGYVYMHQGCCEHLLELKDVRTVQAADPKLASAFPVILFQERKVRRLCNLCKSTASVWVTHDDKYAPENPCFWCEDCYHQMHYDASNTLLYSDYIALPYQWEMGMVKSIYNDNEKKSEEAV